MIDRIKLLNNIERVGGDAWDIKKPMKLNNGDLIIRRDDPRSKKAAYALCALLTPELMLLSIGKKRAKCFKCKKRVFYSDELPKNAKKICIRCLKEETND